MKAVSEFTKGLFKDNPVFILCLGLCPTLAVSTNVKNAIGMGLSAMFVLLGSNFIISLIRNIIPPKIRIPCFIVVIATFVTLVELFLQAFQPDLYKELGLFVPLIVVNCIILGRAEAFASKNGPIKSILDALGMGIGFTGALILLAALRESLGSGTIWGYTLVPGFKPILIMVLSPGAFLTLGLTMGYFNWLSVRRKR